MARASKGGGDSSNTTEFIEWLLYMPITKGYCKLSECKDGTLTLEDIYRLNEICLHQIEEERALNGK